MLKSEIEPFAQAHIEALEGVIEQLQKIRSSSNENDPIVVQLERSIDTIRSSKRAFYRFQVCMIDEHNIKERAEERARHCRLHHKDQ